MSTNNQDVYTRFEVIMQEDPETGDLLLPIPPALLEKMGWKEGQDIEITVDELGRYVLKRLNQ